MPVSRTPLHHITLFNGCNIAYTDEGQFGETLIFIHGLGTYSGTWHKNTSALKDHYRCIAIDLPGNGHSTTGDYPYTMDFFAHCIIDFIGRMGLEKVTLVGHSMGGQIVLTAALMTPECCERIILCSPAGFEQFSNHERMMYETSLQYMSLFTSNEQAIQHLIHTGFYHFPKDARQLESELLTLMRQQPAGHYKKMTDRCIAGMFAAPVFSRLKEIKKEVLIFFGEHDALIPNTLFHPTSTKKIAESGKHELPHSKLKLLRKCGHFAQWECADEMNQGMLSWLKKAAKTKQSI